MKAKSFAVLGVVSLCIIGGLVLQAGGRLPFLDQWLDSLNPFKSKPTIITMSDAIITDINQVSELTTTIYVVQQVEKKKDAKFLASYVVIMVLKGTVEAGLDLTQLDASDIRVSEDGKSVTVNLPPVMILTESKHILSSNPDDTYVYDSKNFAWGDFDKVEPQMRADAGPQILETACKDGILNDATVDAKETIEKFLKTTRPDVNITVVSAPVPSLEECKNMGETID